MERELNENIKNNLKSKKNSTYGIFLEEKKIASTTGVVIKNILITFQQLIMCKNLKIEISLFHIAIPKN
jgi:hypothetical protein